MKIELLLCLAKLDLFEFDNKIYANFVKVFLLNATEQAFI